MVLCPDISPKTLITNAIKINTANMAIFICVYDYLLLQSYFLKLTTFVIKICSPPEFKNLNPLPDDLLGIFYKFAVNCCCIAM